MTSTLLEHVTKDAWRLRAGRANGSDAGPWEAAVKSVVEFQHLGENWDGLQARPPSRELLESAIGLAHLLNERGVDPPSSVVPGLEGSVLFEWQFPDGTYAEIEVDRPLHAEAMMIKPGQDAEHWTLPTE
jgi:hypothetical protein